MKEFKEYTMPKTYAGQTKPKEHSHLVDSRYDNKNVIKSMNSYEKFLFRCEQAAKAARLRAPRQEATHDKGELCCLFSTVH